MNCYILVDFGSTYTKLTLVDIDEKCVVLNVCELTTVSTNIRIGYEKALDKLKKKIDFKNLNIVDILACSSAGGGLKMIAIGITPTYTVKAAKNIILGAGARILKSYSYFLKEEDIKEIDRLNPDIILLTGGAENGNIDYIVHNAKYLLKLEGESPVIVAGNSSANKVIKELFKNAKKELIVSENIMPDVNKINANPTREEIRKVFMQQIVVAKGMEDINKITKNILMPTPTAVLKAAKLLSEGLFKGDGCGEIMVIDIGGATTDVHSISDPIKEKDLFIEDLEDLYEKRTVEGDLGMRYSAISLYENVGEKNFLKYKKKSKILRKSVNLDVVIQI